MTDEPTIQPIPDGLQAAGTMNVPFEPVLAFAELPAGSLHRVTRGDLDILLAHTSVGLVATDDRCPHMSAPLSQGRLEDCVVDCPLHSGRFDLASGDAVQFPSTGGLDAEGTYHSTWQTVGSPPKPEPTDAKAMARAATRVRRLRYYPVRVRDGIIEIRLPRP